MKIVTCLAFLFAAGRCDIAFAGASPGPFGVSASTRRVTSNARARATKSSTTATDAVLNLRGGASSNAELAMKVFQVLMGTHGIVAERAACKTPSLMYNGIFDDLEENSVGEFAMETVGTSLIGTVLMSYLSIYTSLSPVKIIAAGSVSCLLLGFKWQWQGKFDAAGFVDGFGLMYVLTFLPLYPILKGMGDTDLLIKIFIGTFGDDCVC